MITRVRCLVLAVALVPLLTAEGARAGVSVLNGLTHRDRAQAGEVYEGEISIGNTSGQPAEVKIYQTDYHFRADGKTAYDPIGSLARSNGPWIRLEAPGLITIAPGAQVTVPYRVRVPQNPSLVGTYWSTVMVEEIPSEVLWGERPSQPGIEIRTKLRYAVQMITDVGNDAAEDLRLIGLQLESSDDAVLGRLRVDLENQGQVIVHPEVRVEIFDDRGQTQGVFVAGKRRLYPSTSTRFTIDLTGVPAGPYKLLMWVRTDSGAVYASEYDLEAN